MIDRGLVEKAAEAGAVKVSLLQEDPLRYMLRAVGAGMGLTLAVFVFLDAEAKSARNPHGCSIGVRLFWGRPGHHRFYEYRIVHQQQYVPDCLFCRRADKLEAGCTAVDFLLFWKSRWCCPSYGIADWRRLSRPITSRSCLVRRRLAQGAPDRGGYLLQRNPG